LQELKLVRGQFRVRMYELLKALLHRLRLHTDDGTKYSFQRLRNDIKFLK
jgi:hypothetical protein